MRLGRDKALEAVGSRNLLQQAISNISFLKSDIIIVTAREQSFSQFIAYPGLRVVTDIYPDKGPLGGIYTGLTMSDSFYNLVVACDMPFLNQALLGYMVELAPNFDLVIPRLVNMIEPLHAVYSKNCLAPMEYLLKQGSLKVRQLFDLIKVRYVETDEINRFDPKHLSFFNINTEADLKIAKQLAKETNIINDKR